MGLTSSRDHDDDHESSRSRCSVFSPQHHDDDDDGDGRHRTPQAEATRKKQRLQVAAALEKVARESRIYGMNFRDALVGSTVNFRIQLPRPDAITQALAPIILTSRSSQRGSQIGGFGASTNDLNGLAATTPRGRQFKAQRNLPFVLSIQPAEGNVSSAEVDLRITPEATEGSYHGQYTISESGEFRLSIQLRHALLDEDIHVRDSPYHIFVKPFCQGKFQAKFGEPGAHEGYFQAPCGVAVDNDTETMYIVDRGQKRISVYNFMGECIESFGMDVDEYKMERPSSIAILTFTENNTPHDGVSSNRRVGFTDEAMYVASPAHHSDSPNGSPPSTTPVASPTLLNVPHAFPPTSETGGPATPGTRARSGSAAPPLSPSLAPLNIAASQPLTQRSRAGSRASAPEQKRGVYIYVADSKLHRVYIFHNSRLYGVFGGKGATDGKFNEPTVSVDQRKHEVYVADKANSRVCVFDHNGNYLRKFGHLPDSQARAERAEEYAKAVAAGIAPPELNLQISTSAGPLSHHHHHSQKSMAVELEHAVASLAAKNNGGKRITAPTGDQPLDGSAAQRALAKAAATREPGTVVARAAPIPGAVRFGADTSDAGRLHLPTHVCVSDSGLVFVSEEMQNRISVFKTNGEYVHSFTNRNIRQPIGVSLGPSNYVYVLSAARHQINVFTPSGEIVTGVTIGGVGSIDGKFKFPNLRNPDGVAGGMCFTNKGQLIVADVDNQRIQILA